jgi:two-component system nitrate/nitrite response regulator NarL
MRILLVDDHTLFREALLHVIKQFDDTAVVIEAATAREARHLAAHYQDLDLILLDLALPDMDGLSVLPELRGLAPATPLVILSASENHPDVQCALDAGAAGYIVKSCSSHEMITALRLVLAGDVYIPPTLLAALEILPSPPAPSTSVQITPVPVEEGGEGGLTPRQVEVLRLMGQGLSNKSIGKRLDLAEGTVKLHVTAVLRVLNASNRTQAVIEASRRGLIPPSVEHGLEAD